jgi:hypothetical protein
MSKIEKFIKNSISITKLAHFAGGIFSGGGQQSQQRALPAVSDTARSVSVGVVTEILCSGGNYGIEGFPIQPDGVGGWEQFTNYVYLGETPISTGFQSGTNTIVWNFTISSFVFKQGAVSETGWNQNYVLSNETSVGAELTYNVPVTRTFVRQNSTNGQILLKFSLVLQKGNLNSSGYVEQVVGNSVQVKVEIQAGSSAWGTDVQTFSGKFSSPYELVVGYPVDFGQKLFNIRVTRLTPTASANDTIIVRWQSYIIQLSDLLALKRMSAVQISFDCDQFGTSFPERRYLINGIYQDRPNNSTVDLTDGGLNYTGNWNGGLTSGSATNDIFCHVWYLLTDKIDGLGYYLSPSVIDRFSLQSISKYNNAYISNSTGVERRHLMQIYITKATDGWQCIDNILSSCNARRFWENGILKFMQDRPSPIFCVVSNVDIVGDFEYSSTDIYERTNAVTVTWIDNNNFGKTRQEYISDPVYIAKYGLNSKEVEAVGCFRRTQAIRYGRSIIYSENIETDVVTFKGRSYLGAVPIGSVILINDAKALGNRIGGIVLSTSGTSVTLDYPVEIPALFGFDEFFYTQYYTDIWQYLFFSSTAPGISTGFEHYLSTGSVEGRLPIGVLLFVNTGSGIQVRRVINTPGTYSTLTVEAAFSTNPVYGDSWALLIPGKNGKTFRVISKEPDDGNLDIFSITATQYREDKYRKIEQRNEATPQANSTVSIAAVQAPTAINLGQIRYPNGTNGLRVTWTSGNAVAGLKYLVGLKKSDVWTESYVFGNDTTFENLGLGNYQVRIAAENYARIKSTYAYSDVFTLQAEASFSQVVLLCPFDTNFADVKGKTVISGGNPVISGNVKLFGQNTLYLDGGSYLYVNHDSSLSMGSGDFTVEYWQYRLSNQDRLVISKSWEPNTYLPNYMITENANFFVGRQGEALAQTGSIIGMPVNQWVHVAAVKNGSIIRTFVDGKLAAEVGIGFTPNDRVADLYLGVGYGSSAFNGYLDNIRITNGFARYTASFTPPLSPFPTYPVT